MRVLRGKIMSQESVKFNAPLPEIKVDTKENYLKTMFQTFLDTGEDNSNIACAARKWIDSELGMSQAFVQAKLNSKSEEFIKSREDRVHFEGIIESIKKIKQYIDQHRAFYLEELWDIKP
jgi:hypothetical protein